MFKVLGNGTVSTEVSNSQYYECFG